jgi:hypothetical protein
MARPRITARQESGQTNAPSHVVIECDGLIGASGSSSVNQNPSRTVVATNAGASVVQIIRTIADVASGVGSVTHNSAGNRDRGGGSPPHRVVDGADTHQRKAWMRRKSHGRPQKEQRVIKMSAT